MTRAADGIRAESTTSQHPRQVYHDGRLVELTVVPGRGDFRIGSWSIAAQIQHDRPKDGHPNLYIVAPGTQYAEPGNEQYSHNEVVSVVPAKPNPCDWDVYVAIVLDPTLREEFRSEQQLIIATQDDFQPALDFNFDDIPGAAFLREYLSINSIDDLSRFRRSDGRLPRLVIVPAQLTLKASAVDPEASPEPNLNSTLPSTARSSVVRH